MPADTQSVISTVSNATQDLTKCTPIQMNGFLIDNVQWTGFQVAIGIPVGTSCVPAFVDLFYSHEANFIKGF